LKGLVYKEMPWIESIIFFACEPQPAAALAMAGVSAPQQHDAAGGIAST
jgi:hypothetical protein